MTNYKTRKRIKVQGIVQGVGFRPSISRQAVLLGLTGTVINTRDSVEIEIQGDEEVVSEFIKGFYSFIPVNALITFFTCDEIAPLEEEESFRIIESRETGPTRFSIPPDIAMCEECRAEFRAPDNRRYQ